MNSEWTALFIRVDLLGNSVFTKLLDFLKLAQEDSSAKKFQGKMYQIIWLAIK